MKKLFKFLYIVFSVMWIASCLMCFYDNSAVPLMWCFLILMNTFFYLKD